QRRDMIFPSVTNDTYYAMDYGYSPQDFLYSYQQALGGHVAYGLFPYLDTRISNTSSQLETAAMIPVIKYIRHKRLTAASLLITAYIEVQEQPTSAAIVYAFEGGEPMDISMFDDGQHEDGDAGDGTYGATIEGIPDQTALTYQVKATDATNLTATLPCDPVYVYGVGGELPVLYINEFMASNETTITDEYGEYDDWIEIYNAEEEAVWLGDKFLTDNMEKPDKWAMPETYIEPGEFMLFWADDQTEQGPFHTNFKLSKDGEDIGITSITQEAIDQYIFGEQSTDVSEGRFPDGADNWVMFESPTPGISNEFTSVEETACDKILIYPNPSYGGRVSLSKPADFEIFNSMGIRVGKYHHSQFFNTRGYNKGMYIVVMDNGQRIKWIRQ
ncbi:MAG: T9SS type A sorting domain-containing protein, partial [bacterium]